MSAGLLLIVVIAAAYLAAHLAFDWLARRFRIVSGAEYLLLGMLLGPQIGRVVGPELMANLSPITTLALGWIGAIIGMQFFVPHLIKVPSTVFQVGVVESLLTGALVAALEAIAMQWAYGLPMSIVLLPAIAMGAIAMTSAASGIGVAARRVKRSVVVAQLEMSTALNALLAIVTLGLLLAINHANPGGSLTATEWSVVSIALGVIGGALFHLFLGAEHDVDRMFIALAGAIILISGAASYLQLSPLLSSMCFGVVLVNTSSSRTEIATALHRVERPFYFVLLIIAGASWAPSARAWLLPVSLFLVARTAAKIGSSRLSARWAGALPTLGRGWGVALLGQGGLALALGLEYLRWPGAPLPNVVFTAAIASVLLTDLFSARFAESVAVRAAERLGIVAPRAPSPTPAAGMEPITPGQMEPRSTPATGVVTSASQPEAHEETDRPAPEAKGGPR